MLLKMYFIKKKPDIKKGKTDQIQCNCADAILSYVHLN